MRHAFHTIDRLVCRYDHGWAKLSVIACSLLLLAIDRDLSFGAGWWLALLAALIAASALLISVFMGPDRLIVANTAAASLVSASLIINVAGVIHHLAELELDEIWEPALVIAITNIGVGAFWYWRLDEGGPRKRAAREKHTVGAFLFPQMQVGNESPVGVDQTSWKPHFIDYLFLAFTTSTSMAPADTPILSRYAKVGTMIQVAISMLMLTLVVSRAVSLIGAA